jgi:hypothetical protein
MVRVRVGSGAPPSAAGPERSAYLVLVVPCSLRVSGIAKSGGGVLGIGFGRGGFSGIDTNQSYEVSATIHSTTSTPSATAAITYQRVRSSSTAAFSPRVTSSHRTADSYASSSVASTLRPLRYDDVTAHAITRDDLAADVRGINASLDLIRETRGDMWPSSRTSRASGPPSTPFCRTSSARSFAGRFCSGTAGRVEARRQCERLRVSARIGHRRTR